MKQRVLVPLLTVLVFAAGFATHVWTESRTALPPPPAPIGSEFALQGAPRPPVPSPRKLIRDRTQIIADIQKLGPQITMFREKIAELDAKYDHEFEAILNEEQRQHRAEAVAAIQKRHAQRPPNAVEANLAPLSDDEILSRQEQGLYTVLTWVTVNAKLETMTKDYKLDAEQQLKARKLVEERRKSFLALIDSVTPPSILYSRLAPDVQRLAEPRK